MSALPRLQWIVDSSAWARSGNSPARVIDAGVEFLHLRDAAVTAARWGALVDSWSERAQRLIVTVNRGPNWAAERGWGAHLKASQPRMDRALRAEFTRLGRSVHDEDELDAALQDRPDYLVIGPVFPTTCKPGKRALGLDRFRRLVVAAQGCAVFGVGGISPESVPMLVAAGAYGVAVLGGISASPRPAERAAAYLATLAACRLPVDSRQA